jgi:hypothetical protein
MSDPLLANAELVLHEKSPTHGLLRRLTDGTLRPKERDALARIQAVQAGEERGQSMAKIAEGLGIKLPNLRAFTQTDQYRAMTRYLAEQDRHPTPVAAADRRATDRAEWNAMSPQALAFYRKAFREDEAGEYLDVDRAERAAKLIADGQGWTTPEPSAPKPPTIKIGVIQTQMSGIAAADRRETIIQVEVGGQREGDHPGEL